MAKGIIKIGGNPTGPSVKTSISVTVDTNTATADTMYIGTNPVGDVVKGILNDVNDLKTDIDFVQPYGMELGLIAGMKVNYTPLNVNGRIIATSVHLLEKGVVETINATNDGGTLTDRASGKSIPFVHYFCKESGILAPSAGNKGSVVSFERIIDPKTATYVATALEVK